MKKELFINIIDTLREEYKRDCDLYEALSKFDIYVSEEREIGKGLDNLILKILEEYFTKDNMDIIISYCYPIFDEEFIVYDEDGNEKVIKNSGELYDFLVKDNFLTLFDCDNSLEEFVFEEE